MSSQPRHYALLILPVLAALATPALAQTDTKTLLLKHLKTSRDFTLKVADQMPDATYDFKLTPQQMSFAEQMVHLAQSQDFYLAAVRGEKPNPAKSASLKKKDVITFVTASFDRSLATVSKMMPDQFSKTFNSDEGTMTGLELVMALLDHTTNHRASAEMYLRAKGITPAQYDF